MLLKFKTLGINSLLWDTESSYTPLESKSQFSELTSPVTLNFTHPAFSSVAIQDTFHWVVEPRLESIALQIYPPSSSAAVAPDAALWK